MMVRTNVSRRRALLPALLVLAAVALSAPAGASAQNFSNNDGIAINDGHCDGGVQERATPYPSTIAVSGLAGRVVKDVNVTLTGFTHTHPADVRVLLVGPQGQTTLLLHENGRNLDANNLTLTFDDAAPASPPTAISALTSGSYKPSNQFEGQGGCDGFVATTSFPAPAPAGPYGAALAGFNGSDPSGDWKLYVVDDFDGDTGSIAGWSLDIVLAPVFDFTGFAAPIDNGVVNAARAGQAIPVKYRLTDGTPVSDPASFVSVTSQSGGGLCAGLPLDAIETYAGSSGLLYLGDGDWQFNWKTPKDYAGQCRTMTLTLEDGSTHTATFQFM